MRNTKTRKGLIKIIKNSTVPLRAKDLRDLLDVNKTTIYRQLENLKQQNLVREVVFGDGKIYYEKMANNCHHHAVCLNCGIIKDITIEEQSLIKSIEKQSSFKIDKHSIEFMGLCGNCK